MQGNQESVVRLFYGDLCAVFGHALDGNALCVLGHFDIAIGDGRNLHLGEGDLVAFRYGGTALQIAVYLCLVGYQFRAGGLADRPHNAQNGAQCVPVIVEPGYKVHLSRGRGELCGNRYVFFCCHLYSSFQKSYLFSLAMLSASAACLSAVDKRYRPLSSFL